MNVNDSEPSVRALKVHRIRVPFFRSVARRASMHAADVTGTRETAIPLDPQFRVTRSPCVRSVTVRRRRRVDDASTRDARNVRNRFRLLVRIIVNDVPSCLSSRRAPRKGGCASSSPRLLSVSPPRAYAGVFGHVGNHFGSSLVGFAEGRIYIPIRVILDTSIEYHSTSLVGPHDHGWKRTASGSVLDLDLATASLATRLRPRIIHPLDRYLNHGWCVGRRRARTVNER